MKILEELTGFVQGMDIEPIQKKHFEELFADLDLYKNKFQTDISVKEKATFFPY